MSSPSTISCGCARSCAARSARTVTGRCDSCRSSLGMIGVLPLWTNAHRPQHPVGAVDEPVDDVWTTPPKRCSSATTLWVTLWTARTQSPAENFFRPTILPSRCPPPGCRALRSPLEGVGRMPPESRHDCALAARARTVQRRERGCSCDEGRPQLRHRVLRMACASHGAGAKPVPER